MKYFNDLEQGFVLGNIEVFNEFDTSHFISNAKTAIYNKAEMVNANIKFDYYTSMIEKGIQNFDGIKLEANAIRDFMELYKDNNGFNTNPLMVKDICIDEPIVIKPQYLNQYIELIRKIIADFTSEKIDFLEASRFMNSEFPMKVEQQMVKSNMSYGVTVKDLRKETVSSTNLVAADGQFIKNKLLPFVSKYATIKSDAVTEANATLNAIKEACESVKSLLAKLDEMRARTDIPMDKLNQINQLAYNSIRGIIEVIAYVSFVLIHKLNVISTNTLTCNKLYIYATNMINVNEGFDDIVVNTNAETMCEDMIAGQTPAFSILANNIYDYHAGMKDPIASANDKEDEESDDIFNEIIKAYIIISEGLNIIAREGGEYLLVFDDVIEKSGFGVILTDRFREVINKIDDITQYSVVDSEGAPINADVYSRVLSEVKNYPVKMAKIADVCNSTLKKLDMLTERFADNINGEFKDMETANELKVFMKDLRDQYIDMSNSITEKCMDRLKSLGNLLTELDTKVSDTPSDSTIPIETSSNLDISESVFDMIVEERVSELNNHMKELQLEYFREKTSHSQGARVIFEEETASTNSGTQTPSNSTKPVVQDNSAPENKSGNNVNAQPVQKSSSATIQNLINKITEFIQKFKDNINKSIVGNKDVNLKYVNDKIESGLLTRSYSNITVQVVQYQDMTTIINNMKTAIGNIPRTPQEVQALNSKADVYAKLFPFISGLNPDDAASTKKQVTNFILVGNKDTEPQLSNVSNSAVKTFLEGTAIPYIKSYYTNIATELSTCTDNLGNALTNLEKAINTEAPQNAGVNESVSIFTEADDPAVNTTTSMSTKVGWIQNAITMYTTEVASCLQKINNDYLTLIKTIKTGEPKDVTGNAQVTDGNDKNTQQ